MADESQLNLIKTRARILQTSGATEQEIASYVDTAMTEAGMPGGEPAAEPTAPAGAPKPASSLAGSILQKGTEFVKNHFNPLKLPILSENSGLTSTLENAGMNVKDVTQKSLRNAAMKPSTGMLPPSLRAPAEAARQVGTMFGEGAIQAAPFTPSEFAMAIGSELAPGVIFSGLGKRAAKFQKNIGDEFIKEAPKARLKAIKYGEPSLGEKFIRETKLPGNTSEAFDESAKMVNELEDQIKDKLSTAAKDSKAIISKQKIAQGFDDVISELNDSGVEGKAAKELEGLKDEFLAKHPETANVEYWNGVKRKLYKLVGDQNYIKDNPSGKIQALKAVASNIRQEVQDAVPGIAGLNKKQGLYLRMQDALANQLAKNPGSRSVRESLKDRALIEGARSKFGLGLPEMHGVGLSVPFIAQDDKR